MASPPIPPLAGRPFSFYPAIRDIAHNKWIFRKSTWSELVVVNSKTGLEISVPRQFVGEVSSSEDPFLIVGLLRELEYRDGAVWPCRRRVIEMPVAVGESPRRAAPGPAPVVGIRLETRRDRRAFKWVGASLAAAIALHALATIGIHAGEVRERPYLTLGARDSYTVVVHRLGKPTDETATFASGHQFRALHYRRFTAILIGPDYAGTMDAEWRPVHTVPVPGIRSTLDALRSLDRF